VKHKGRRGVSRSSGVISDLLWVKVDHYHGRIQGFQVQRLFENHPFFGVESSPLMEQIATLSSSAFFSKSNGAS
jgi:hypothetical protein